MNISSSIELVQTAVKGVRLPPEIKWMFYHEIEKWYRCSGPEWTVGRLKSLYTDLVRMKAGLTPMSQYVAKKADGSFKGIVGTLFTLAAHSSSNFKKVAKLMRVYTAFVSPTFTQTQRDKYESGVRAQPVYVARKYFRALDRAVENIPPARTPVPIKLMDLPVSWHKNAPLLSEQLKRKRHTYSVPAPKGLVDSVDSLTWSKGNLDLFSRHKDIYMKVLAGLEDMIHLKIEYLSNWEPPKDWWRRPLIIGRISFNQEPGYKARTVASPLLVHQAAMFPLEQSLFQTLKGLPWDCTFDQAKALPFIRDHLSQGKTAYSCDLSSATDLFPLELQVHVLRLLGFDRYASLFEELSRGNFEQPDGSLISWSKGQPLGLRASFPIFALTHGLLLLALAGYTYSDQFFVLGDDVIILDTDLNSRYRKMLTDLGCKVSEAKTLVSNCLAEFAGYIVDPKGWFLPPKYKQVSEENLTRFLTIYGRHGEKLLPQRLRKLARELESIPKSRGGLGWIESGEPEEVQVALYDLRKVRGLPPSAQRESQRYYQRLIYESKAIALYAMKETHRLRTGMMSDKDMRSEYRSLVKTVFGQLQAGSLPVGALERNVNVVREQLRMDIIHGDRAFHDVKEQPSKADLPKNRGWINKLLGWFKPLSR